MNERRPTLCIVAEPNGSGKTTTTIQLLKSEWSADSLYINPDNIAQIQAVIEATESLEGTSLQDQSSGVSVS